MSESPGPDPAITSEWLQSILHCYHSYSNCKSKDSKDADDSDLEVEVDDFEIEPGCSNSEVLLSDLLAIQVSYKLNSNPISLHLMVKLLPQDPFSRFFVQEAQFDFREIQFYTQVVPELESLLEGCSDISVRDKLSIPQCYYARYQEGLESVLVLENLCPQGFSTPDFTRGLTLGQARSALASIAQVHAFSLVLKVRCTEATQSGAKHDGEEEGEAPLLSKYPFLFRTDRATDSYQHLIDKGFPQLAAFLESKPDCAQILERMKKLTSRSKELIAQLLQPREPLALLTHTDFWCNNLMFSSSTGNGSCNTSKQEPLDPQCRILDWQMITYSQATNDLALLLLTSLPTQLRREHSQELLFHYWDCFSGWTSRLGIDVESTYSYGRAQLLSDYSRSQLLALLLCVGSIDLALGHPSTELRLLDLLQDLHDEGLL